MTLVSEIPVNKSEIVCHSIKMAKILNRNVYVTVNTQSKMAENIVSFSVKRMGFVQFINHLTLKNVGLIWLYEHQPCVTVYLNEMLEAC